MVATIKQDFAGRTDRQFKFKGENPCTYITVHETDNTSRGAGAQAHAAFQKNGGGGASWHYQVDDKNIIQSYPDTRRLWHAGDGQGHGNMSSIGIETCVNPDSDWDATKQNLAELIVTLMKRHNIPVSKVVQHNYWSGKNCPRKMRANSQKQWNELIAQVKALNREGTVSSKQTVKVDGCTVPVGTAAAFKTLAAAFKKATGYTLHVRDGLRTYSEQADLYRRWKAGTFSAPSVAPPGTSLHESGKALDIYDSGSTHGVTVAGNTRSNWIKKNAKKYNFDPAGYGFSEPWHIEYMKDPWKIPTTSKPVSGKRYVGKLKVAGNGKKYTIMRLQTVLGTKVTGKIGPQYVGNKKYLPAFHTISYTKTGGNGSLVVKALQKKLGVKVDGQFGPATIKAWQKKLGVTPDGYAGKDMVKAIQRALNKGMVW